MTDPSSLGVLDLANGGAGFLRRREASYLPESGDVHVPARLVRELDLRPGDEVAGETGRAEGRGRGPALTKVTAVNGRPPAELRHRPKFASLRSVHPDERLVLDCGLRRRGEPDLTNRVIDLFVPFGKGQRALVVAPAKAGKTTVLQNIAQGIAANHPSATLFILLVDERPEEVTEMEACGVGEVIASSFDNEAKRHVAVADLTLERARRRVEQGEDVVLIVDSITRLARAHNAAERGSGRTLSGGLGAEALERPKRFLGSARKVDERHGGGSLTIVATALVDTGSRMDQVIFEEFKGTGNSELVLSRELAERRIFPAVDLQKSATRREELLLPPAELELARRLRQQLAGLSPADAMTRVATLLKRHPTPEALTAAVS
ncbi:MAG TPA: transcription termination factor Rho [Gemmatimonadales bacterium]|nr:transcription termination factor Rho [Gemmatimonadales bacterium]